MNPLISKWLSEKNLFYLVLLVNLVLVSLIQFYPSMDGPAHLYNSSLIWHLLVGDSSTINDFFILNTFPIPNWIGHFILLVFNSFLPGFLAEKALLFFYIIGLSVSFRLLVKHLHPTGNGLTLFIFPFAYSFLFHLGFYNYSISFMFLFFTLYYWLKTENEVGVKKHFVLFLLLALCYFSSIPAFLFTGICLGLFLVSAAVAEFIKTKELKLVLLSFLKKGGLLLLIALPTLVLFLLFYDAIVFSPSTQEYPSEELLTWIQDVRPIIVYNYEGEVFLTTVFFYLMLAIAVFSLFLRVRKKTNKKWFYKFNTSDLILIPTALALVLLFITPDGSNAGMMSDRYALLFYMLLLIWVSSQELPMWVSRLSFLIILAAHIPLLLTHRNASQKALNTDAKFVSKAAEHIVANSVVLPVNLTDNWLEGHFSNYLGIDKPLVILENYEADVKWFPVKWNVDVMPMTLLGDKPAVAGVSWVNNFNTTQTRQIDYVVILGDTSKLNAQQWHDLNNELNLSYQLENTSENGFVNIYHLKK